MTNAKRGLDEGSGVTTLELDQPTLEGPWRLQLSGPGGSRAFMLAEGEILTLGSRRDAQIVVQDPTVSGQHVSLTALARGVLVEDLASKNGVVVGGVRVQNAMLTGPGSRFVMGRTTVAVTPRNANDAGEPLIAGLIGNSPPMRRLAAEIRRVAALDAPVLLEGESGSGKDVVARAIHVLSGRRGRYVPLNAGALGEALADSELFGHCKGAFTGAIQNRTGAFEQADRGTLFLDEIADLAPSIQVKLLRAVEEGEVRPLGGATPIKVRARVVAASWMPLSERIDRGQFRADLYHRISTFVIKVPPLRQRKSDIPALVKALLESKKAELGERQLSQAALERLETYSFPGNVRELFSIVYRAAALSDGREIGPADIDASLPMASATQVKATSLDAKMVLDAHGGNVSAAARSARVARSTFRSWLKRSPLPGLEGEAAE